MPAAANVITGAVGTGTISHTAGNCNGGVGFLAGTNVGHDLAEVVIGTVEDPDRLWG